MILYDDPPFFRARVYAVCSDKAVAIGGFHEAFPPAVVPPHRRAGIHRLPLPSTCPQDSPPGKVHREPRAEVEHTFEVKQLVGSTCTRWEPRAQDVSSPLIVIILCNDGC